MKKLIMTLLVLFVVSGVYSQSDLHFIGTSTDSVYYEVTGEGNPVLFLSGGPGAPPHSLSPIVDYVSKNHCSILLHQRGTGRSGNNRIDYTTITLEQFVEDISDVLEKEGIDKICIVGHSWGAMLALEYAVRNPEKIEGLVLTGAPGCSLDFVQGMNDRTFSRITPEESDSLQLYVRQLQSTQDSGSQGEISEKMGRLILSKQFYDASSLDELLSHGGMNMEVNHLMMNNLLMKRWNIKEELGRIEAPVVIINGSYDPIEEKYALDLKESLKNCRLHLLEECGHYTWLEKPEELQAIIEEFLLEISSRSQN